MCSDRTVSTLDVRGLACPLPILRTRALLNTLPVGAEIEVLATDPASIIDFKHFCNVTGHDLLAMHQEDGVFRYHLRKAATRQAE